MGQYNDLFMRDNFGDTGQQPTPDAFVSASPDIIPYAQNTLTSQQLVTNYGPPLLNLPLQNNQINRIYVRACNLYNGASSGQIYLYYATGNLLVNVSAWKSNQVQNANGTFAANISATQYNQVAPGDQPFLFNPPTSLGTHFCFLARVSTQMNPNPLPTSNFNSWQDFVNWVRNNANIAWHNVDIVNTLTPQGYINNLVFQNLNNASQFYGFQTSYQNMPAGSVLRLWADPNPSVGFLGFDSGSVTTTQASGSFGQGAVFPAGYQTTINTTCTFPGGPVVPPAGASILTDSLGYVSNANAPQYKKYRNFMVSPSKLQVSPKHNLLKAASLPSSSGLVQITSFTAAFNPTSGGLAQARLIKR